MPKAQTTDAADRRDRLVLVLALNSGVTDAVGLVALGGAFTSVMTGNLVLVGAALSRQDGTLLIPAASAVIAFVTGCAVGARVAGTGGDSARVWPTGVTRALVVQLGLTVCFAAGWWASGPDRDHTVRLALLATNAVSLGLQSGAVTRFGVPGLSTTYFTGTLTNTVLRLASGSRPRDVGLSMRLLGALVLGATLGAGLAARVPALVPLALLLCVAGVLVAAPRDRAHRVGAAEAE